MNNRQKKRARRPSSDVVYAVALQLHESLALQRFQIGVDKSVQLIFVPAVLEPAHLRVLRPDRLFGG